MPVVSSKVSRKPAFREEMNAKESLDKCEKVTCVLGSFGRIKNPWSKLRVET